MKLFYKGILPFLTISIFFIFSTSVLYGQSTQKSFNIDYYGVLTSQVDSNMTKMTSDLYYTQLCEIDNFTVSDKREVGELTQAPDTNNLSTSALSFYTVINKLENSNKWAATITLVDKNADSKYTQTKEYDSFYKILMEPKAVLQESIKNLIKNGTATTIDSSATITETSSNQVASTEFLSGTWEGEESIDKIVIMRGGRGFVVFENGASMNISVELKNNQVIITQKGKSNASFYPEISRQLALKEAINAEPIQWIFSISNNDTLTGNKTTLIESNGAASKGILNITWKRKS